METREERQEQADALAGLLGVALPGSYRQFLVASGSAHVYGLPVLGLPVSLGLDSAWGATELVRSSRPDLPPVFLAIRLMDSRALCLQVSESPAEDAPLIEIDLTATTPPRDAHDSFARYLAEGLRSERHVQGALRRVERLLSRSRAYSHDVKGEPPPFRARDWRILRSCVHDQVVGLAALRHNEEFNGLEVDVFLTTDHPGYEPGHGLRALALILLSDAYRNGATMEIRFTRAERNRRVPERVPRAFSALASEIGVPLQGVEQGVISHGEAVDLYSAIVGFPRNVHETVAQLQSVERLTLQGLCYLVGTRLWTVEEASWIVLNSPRPEGVLFGQDVPEDRLQYLESLSYGRAALAATKLWLKLGGAGEQPERECRHEPRGLLWCFYAPHDFRLDWDCSGEPVTLNASEPMWVLARPRQPLPGELDRVVADASTLASKATGAGAKCLLYSAEFASTGLAETTSRVRERFGVRVLIFPFECRELDEEIDRRMSRARVLRK